MEFDAHKPIYLQICDQIYEKILKGTLLAEDRIQSVREMGVELGVNPNTIMRSYDNLQSKGIIYNKRGIGYFISQDAKDLVIKEMREYFFINELPLMVKKINLLKIGIDELVDAINKKDNI